MLSKKKEFHVKSTAARQSLRYEALQSSVIHVNRTYIEDPSSHLRSVLG